MPVERSALEARPAAGGQPLIRLADRTERYEGAGHPAVDDVSVAVESGEAVAVKGLSGSGKREAGSRRC